MNIFPLSPKKDRYIIYHTKYPTITLLDNLGPECIKRTGVGNGRTHTYRAHTTPPMNPLTKDKLFGSSK